MTGLSWRLVEFLTGVLDARERDAILGDIAESGESFGRAAFDLLSLAGRRQIALWKYPRPWLALEGLTEIGGIGIIRIIRSLDIGLSLQIDAWWRFGVPYETGQTMGHEILRLSGLFLCLLVCSWAFGIATTWISRKTTWLTSTVLFLMVARFLWVSRPRSADAPLLVLQVVLFTSLIIPAISGTRLILRRNN